MKKEYETYHVTESYQRHLLFSCVLAYLPFLFWIPLLTGSKKTLYRRCANQGLWITISWILSIVIILGAGYLLLQTGITDGLLHGNLYFLKNFDQWPLIAQLLLELTAIPVFGLIVFTPVNSIRGFLRGLNSGEPYRIPLLGRIELIHTMEA